jgi:excisionase family DNA binding protein
MNKDILAVDIREAARRLGLSPRTVATLVSRRELPSCKVGRRRIIPIAALEAFIRTGHRVETKLVAVTERPGI